MAGWSFQSRPFSKAASLAQRGTIQVSRLQNTKNNMIFVSKADCLNPRIPIVVCYAFSSPVCCKSCTRKSVVSVKRLHFASLSVTPASEKG